jgi:hypothetical protein
MLDAGPLFRAALWNVGHGEHRLVFAMHHIMFDGWSGGLFFRELFTAYNEIRGGALQAPTPGPNTSTLRRGAEALRRAAAQLDRELEYWKEQLAGTLAPPRRLRPAGSAGFAHRSGREAFVCPRQRRGSEGPGQGIGRHPVHGAAGDFQSPLARIPARKTWSSDSPPQTAPTAR